MPEPDGYPAVGGAARLGLGTVQFGLDYGVTNEGGKVPPRRARAILELAESRGIGLLDTAALYGSSEAVLGELGAGDRFSIVTKTVKTAEAPDAASAADAIERSFDQSLTRLRVDRVRGLLLHDSGDLAGPHAEVVWGRMNELKRSGRVAKIGASVYEGHEIDRILAKWTPDIIQLPINAIDRRLEEGGQLEALARRNIEVHARSVFLQGLLLQPPETIAEKFAALRTAASGLRECFTAAGLSIMEGLLASVFRHRAISRIIVGATSRQELSEIVAAAEKVVNGSFDIDFDRFAVSDRRLLNPALWNTL